MPIHKLATGPITLTIAAVQPTEGSFGPQVKFDGTDGTAVFISELSATKQLARLNLTYDSAVGKTLRFEQIKRDGKTFTNIDLAAALEAGTATAVNATAPVAARPAAAAPMDFEATVQLYAKCVNMALIYFGSRLEEAGIAPDAASIQAAAATIFIKATR